MRLLLPMLLLAVQTDTLDTELRRVLSVSVRIEVFEGRYLSIASDSVPAGDPAASLVNGHHLVFDYLLTNIVPPLQLFAGVDPNASDTARTRRFTENFLRDPTARSALGAYYRSLLPPAAAGRFRRDVPAVAEDRVLALASRFFHAARIIGDTVRVYRCAGINGITELGPARDILVEAFAFATILPTDSATQLNHDFEAAYRRVQHYALQADTGAALKLARVDMYAAMARSRGLRSVLREAYRTWGGALPFRVPDWER